MKISKKILRELEINKNLAREKLYQIIDDNESELLLARQMKRTFEKLFVSLWCNYIIDKKFVEKEFLECCEQLTKLIIEEHRVDEEFQQTCEPLLDNFKNLSKEYDSLKIESSTRRGKQK